MITYAEGINALMDAHRLLERSGTPSEAIERLLNAQVAGWLSEGLTTPEIASQVVDAFNQCMILMRPLGEPLTSSIKLDIVSA